MPQTALRNRANYYIQNLINYSLIFPGFGASRLLTCTWNARQNEQEKNNNNARAKKEKLTAPKVSEVHGKTLILLSFCAIQRLFCYEPVDWI